MKKLLNVFVLLSSVLCFVVDASAVPTTITDNYVGGSPTAPAYVGQDVIGSTSYFGTDSLIVDAAGGMLSIQVISNYFDNVGKYYTALGDLFISTDGWTPYGTAPYSYDSFSNGTTWEYALVLDNHGEAYAASGSATSMIGASGALLLYQITNPAQIILSSAPAGYIYRADQAVQLNTAGLTLLGTGTWSIADLPGEAGVLQLSIANSLTGNSTWGFHWTPTCANDVVEGSSNVPEPATALLLASGLAFLRRRRG